MGRMLCVFVDVVPPQKCDEVIGITVDTQDTHVNAWHLKDIWLCVNESQ